MVIDHNITIEELEEYINRINKSYPIGMVIAARR